MCGICGSFEYSSARPGDADRLDRMQDLLSRRGPDGRGRFLSEHEGIALGHTRLAIIDLCTGAQPISNEDGTIHVVFNGEIYNFKALRADLQSHGHVFRTQSDTETLVHLYEEKGEQLVQDLLGDFAFALWDGKRRSLLLARDRLGVKPLYYSDFGGRVTFASTLPALLAGAAIPTEIDPQGLFCYLTFQSIHAPLTMYKHVRKLPPGHLLKATLGGRVEVLSYWDFDMNPIEGRSDAEWEAELDVLLRDAVRRQMIADVPIGAFLSGGVDSSTVVKLMHDAVGERVKTFSIGFRERAYDESAYFNLMRDALGIEHHATTFEPDLLMDAGDVVRAFGEPCSIGSAFPLYHLSRLAAGHVKVVLSGDGPDEVFAGYDLRYRHLQRLVSLQRVSPSAVLGALEGALSVTERLPATSRLGNHLRRLRKAAATARLPRRSWMTFLAMNRSAFAAPARLLSPDVLRQVDQPLPYELAFDRYADSPDWMTPFIYADVRTLLPGEMFTKLDSMTMAHSVEGRVPLSDHRIVELAARMPSRLKFHGGRGKRVFRAVAARRLPSEILSRPKVGFRVPLNEWFRGELRDLASELPSASGILSSGLFDTAAVRRVVDDHLSGRDHLGGVVWSLVAFDLWWRTLHVGGGT